MPVSRRRFLAALPAFKALLAQTQPKFSAEVNVVNLLATVRDKAGHIVSNLSKEDLVLEEDGRPQSIRYFSRETDLPLTLGLLVDTSLSQWRVLDDERTASRTFFEQVLREDKDHAFVIHFDREVELLQDLTSSRQKLEKALTELQSPQRPRQQPEGGGQRGGGWRRRIGTQLYDAILLASDELMKKQKGRKALIVLSDGVDYGSKVPITEAFEAAQRSDSLVYSILFASQARPGGFGGFGGPGVGRRRGGMSRFPQERPDGKKVLQRISSETGAGFFEVSKKQPIDQIYTRIQEELRNQYSLGYTPDQPSPDGTYRKISLTAKKKGLIVQTREGYYPVISR